MRGVLATPSALYLARAPITPTAPPATRPPQSGLSASDPAHCIGCYDQHYRASLPNAFEILEAHLCYSGQHRAHLASCSIISYRHSLLAPSPQLLFITHGVFIEFWTRKLAPPRQLQMCRFSHTAFTHMYPFPFSWMSSFIELVVFVISRLSGTHCTLTTPCSYSIISFASLKLRPLELEFPDTALPVASRKDYFILAFTLTLGRSLTSATLASCSPPQSRLTPPSGMSGCRRSPFQSL